MGCGASAPHGKVVQDPDSEAILPSPKNVYGEVKTVEVVRTVYPVASLDHLSLQKLLATATASEAARFQDYVLKLVNEYSRRSFGPDDFNIVEQTLVGNVLEGCVFVGHIMTDLDSIAGALGAATLFNGIATRSEDSMNGEILYALKYAELEPPPFFDTVAGAGFADADGKMKNVCLVDHNEEKQMTPKLRECPKRKDRIVGLIDHHAMSEAFSTERALFVDVRPWGSMSSIIAHTFIRECIPMKKSIARILLCAILSDTLNLRSVTTSNADRLMVAVLAILGSVGDANCINSLAENMFRAKTEWIVSLGAKAMVRADQKDFSANGWKFGVAVLEVTCPDAVYPKVTEIASELRNLKEEKGKDDPNKKLDMAFLFIVDITKQRSDLVICGSLELELARAAFPNCPYPGNLDELNASFSETSSMLMDVGGLVSRKSQFAPAFLKTLNEGFTSSQSIEQLSKEVNELLSSEV